MIRVVWLQNYKYTYIKVLFMYFIKYYSMLY